MIKKKILIEDLNREHSRYLAHIVTLELSDKTVQEYEKNHGIKNLFHSLEDSIVSFLEVKDEIPIKASTIENIVKTLVSSDDKVSVETIDNIDYFVPISWL